MARLPDHYESLNVSRTASQQEIERAYTELAAKLRIAKGEDALDELAEIEAAHGVLSQPAERANYDALLRETEAEEDKKYAELDALLQRGHHHHRKTIRGSSGLLDAIWAILSFFFKFK